MAPNVDTVETAGELKLVITRHLDAPRELVWKAWSEPTQLMQWSCPKGFEVIDLQSDFHPGGRWRSGMRSPEGRDYFAHGEYRQITEPGTLLSTHAWELRSGATTRQTEVMVTFEEQDGRCLMTFEQRNFQSEESRDSHEEGWNEAFDKLQDHLSRRVEYCPRSITITRVFNASRQSVWNAFTDSDALAGWWGPKGFSTRIEENDVRPGGKWRYVMVAPDGEEYPATGVFREVVAPERFMTSDEFGEDYVPPPGVDLPTGIAVTLKLEEQGNQTKLSLIIMHPSSEDREKHEKLGVVAGWDSSLDCLQDYLDNLI